MEIVILIAVVVGGLWYWSIKRGELFARSFEFISRFNDLKEMNEGKVTDSQLSALNDLILEDWKYNPLARQTMQNQAVFASKNGFSQVQAIQLARLMEFRNQ